MPDRDHLRDVFVFVLVLVLVLVVVRVLEYEDEDEYDHEDAHDYEDEDDYEEPNTDVARSRPPSNAGKSGSGFGLSRSGAFGTGLLESGCAGADQPTTVRCGSGGRSDSRGS